MPAKICPSSGCLEPQHCNLTYPAVHNRCTSTCIKNTTAPSLSDFNFPPIFSIQLSFPASIQALFFPPHKIIIDLILCLPPTLCLSRYNIPILCILSASVYFSLCPSVSVQSSPFCCTSDHQQCSHRPRPTSQLKPIQDKAPTILTPDRCTSPPFQPPQLNWLLNSLLSVCVRSRRRYNDLNEQ